MEHFLSTNRNWSLFDANKLYIFALFSNIVTFSIMSVGKAMFT